MNSRKLITALLWEHSWGRYADSYADTHALLTAARVDPLYAEIAAQCKYLPAVCRTTLVRYARGD